MSKKLARVLAVVLAVILAVVLAVVSCVVVHVISVFRHLKYLLKWFSLTTPLVWHVVKKTIHQIKFLIFSDLFYETILYK